MTAEVFTAVVRPPTTFSLAKKNRGNSRLGSAAVAALADLTNNSTVDEALDILSSSTGRDYRVLSNQFGHATSVQAS